MSDFRTQNEMRELLDAEKEPPDPAALSLAENLEFLAQHAEQPTPKTMREAADLIRSLVAENELKQSQLEATAELYGDAKGRLAATEAVAKRLHDRFKPVQFGSSWYWIIPWKPSEPVWGGEAEPMSDAEHQVLAELSEPSE